MNPFLMGLASIGLSVAAQFALKAGMSSGEVKAALGQPFGLTTLLAILANWQVLCGFLFYGVGAIVWLGVLSKWDVSKAYPMVGFGFVLTLAVGWMVGEQIDTMRLFGVALICGGVFFVGQS